MPQSFVTVAIEIGEAEVDMWLVGHAGDEIRHCDRSPPKSLIQRLPHGWLAAAFGFAAALC